jgi:hypothetical protein
MLASFAAEEVISRPTPLDAFAERRQPAARNINAENAIVMTIRFLMVSSPLSSPIPL